MRLGQEMEDAFNGQISVEMGSSLAYLQMAAYFEGRNLTGMSRWMRFQAEEEREHAYRFIDFILNRGGTVKIGSVDAPRSDYSSPTEVFETALAQERAVTKTIHDLYHLATAQGDLASYPFLQEFINEQVEEESTVETILERLRLAGGDSGALLLLDTELGARQQSAL